MNLTILKFLVSIVFSISTLVGSLLLIYFAPNLWYFIRTKFTGRTPRGRPPSEKPGNLWILFWVSVTMTILTPAVGNSLTDALPTQYIPTPISSETSTPTFLPSAETPTFSPTYTFTPTATWTPLPTLTLTPPIIPTIGVEDQLVQLIDKYRSCLNDANPEDTDDSDYETCWNLLSNRTGEIQSNLNKNDYISYWKKYKITYVLYYCSKGQRNFVDEEYYLYDRNDLSHPLGNGTAFHLEYSFALDENGWRIKGADATIFGIGSYCESQPRIEKLTLRL